MHAESNKCHWFLHRSTLSFVTVYVDRSRADKLFDKVKIICIVPTIQEHVDNGRVQIINATWGRKCNKILFSLCPREQHHGFINTCMFGESKANLIGKITYSLFHVYTYFMEEFDWILKADDDTFIVMENLRYLLSNYDSNDAGYTGYHFRVFLHQGYNSGGAGYAISKQGLRQMVLNGYEDGLCEISGETEDLEIGKCFEVDKLLRTFTGSICRDVD